VAHTAAMFSQGSKRFATPRAAAVSGISCMSPPAPLGETAVGSKADSVRITDWTSAALTPYCREISRMSSAYAAHRDGGSLSHPAVVPDDPRKVRYRGSAARR
jgi:hypothetical protein